MSGGRVLAFVPDRDTGGKKDASGAFWPEAAAFLTMHGADPHSVHRIDISQPAPARRAQVLDVLGKSRGVEVVAAFCHGLQRGLQLGFNLDTADELAVALAACVNGNVLTLPLYACSTASGPADGDGMFADVLRDELCRAGLVYCQVDAHTTAGHATYNPNVRRFSGDGSATGGQGGQWIVRPGAKLWKRWVTEMRGPLRFRFPFMSVAEIHSYLALQEAA